MAQAGPATYNLRIRKGSNWELNIVYKDEAKNPIDLTGYKAWLTIRPTVEGEQIEQLTELTGITLGGAAGTIDSALTHQKTTGLPIKRGVYDLLLEDNQATAERFALLEGDVEVMPAVTRGV